MGQSGGLGAGGGLPPRGWQLRNLGQSCHRPVSTHPCVSFLEGQRHSPRPAHRVRSVTRAGAGGHVGALPVADSLEACCAGSVQWFSVGGNGGTRGSGWGLGEAVRGAGWAGLAPGSPLARVAFLRPGVSAVTLPVPWGTCSACLSGQSLPGHGGFCLARAASPGQRPRWQGKDRRGLRGWVARGDGHAHSALCCSEKRAESHKYARFLAAGSAALPWAAAPGPPPAHRWQGPADPSCPEVRTSSTLWGPDWGKEQPGRDLGDPGFLLWGDTFHLLAQEPHPHALPRHLPHPPLQTLGSRQGRGSGFTSVSPLFNLYPTGAETLPVPADWFEIWAVQAGPPVSSRPPWTPAPPGPSAFSRLSPASRSPDAPGVPGVGTSARAATSRVAVSSPPQCQAWGQHVLSTPVRRVA